MSRLLCLFFLVLPVPFAPSAQGRSAIDGRYVSGWMVVRIETDGAQTVVRPIWWGGYQLLTQRSPQLYEMANRRECAFTFSDKSGNKFQSLTIEGHSELNGVYRRLGPAKAPLESLIEGDPNGDKGLLNLGVPSAQVFDLVQKMVYRVPSMRPALYKYVKHRASTPQTNLPWPRLAGDAAVTLGRRTEAERFYRMALADGHEDAEASTGLRMLGALPSDAGWRLSFPLSATYERPTRAETDAVAADWASRDLRPADIRLDATRQLEVAGVRVTATVLSYTVHGERNHGAVLVPEGARPASCPVLVDLKGVSPDFSPLDVPESLLSPRVLGGDLQRFVIFAPAVRGERLIFGGRTFQSEGNPAESWDGATDDAIAFITAGLQHCSACDPDRILALGRSRGGTVAMLLGERDPRVKALVSWSGPAGWIENMPQLGWSQLEQVREGLRSQAGPTATGGQSIRTFLSAALAGRESLAQVRHRLIASSPIYFADRLPPAQLHYGENDFVVEPRNGRDLEAALRSFPVVKQGVRFYYEPDGGHDLNPLISIPTTRQFLLAHARRKLRSGTHAAHARCGFQWLRERLPRRQIHSIYIGPRRLD
jgi:hypothetical protein